MQSCCSPIASASASARHLQLHPLQLLLPDCVHFSCCSPIAFASTAAPRLRPLQLLLPIESASTLALNPGAEEGEKSAWYPLFAHAPNYYIKPRGFMQMMSQNFPSVNNDVYTTQRNHKDMMAALTLTFGTWSVISAMRDETTMTTLSSRASFTSNTNGITQ